MGKGAIALGIALIIFGLALFIFIPIVGLIYGSISIIIGIALMIFWKEEDIVEQRKDLKPKKTRK